MGVDEPRIRRLFEIPIHAVTMDEVLALIEARIESGRGLLIGVVNAAKVVNMRRDEALRRAVLAADVILADGMSVVWAGRLLGHPLPARVAGIDLMTRMLERAGARGYRLFCLGATDEVLQAVLRRISRDFPGIKLVGSHHGYFAEHEEEAIAEQIAAARPDILLAAMSSPKKEQFLARWADRLGGVVCHGVGGAFDVIAGKVRRAPRVWQVLGLEWFYRVLQEPGRLWRRYLVTNTVFIGIVAAELLHGQRNGRFPGASL